MFFCAQDDVIPLKFHKISGIKDHEFRIRTDRYLNKPHHDDGYLVEIYINNQWVKIRLPFNEYPHQIEALAILSILDGESERQGRYINVHIAYEAAVKDRDVEYSSIRHALAHPITKLTRANVKKSLVSRFGRLDIDFKNHQHQKEIFRCIGQMLIKIEEAIFEDIVKDLSTLTKNVKGDR